jgi:protein TonB
MAGAAAAVAARVLTPVAAPSAPSAGRQLDHPINPVLTSRIRAAVQQAVRCPAAARMMGKSGKAGLAFDYRDGALVSGAQIARSSDTPVLDTAALTAVRQAHYPQPPPDASNQLFHLLIWIEEACGG